jgi:hypothetical protein
MAMMREKLMEIKWFYRDLKLSETTEMATA